jgi:hypothetical protein
MTSGISDELVRGKKFVDRCGRLEKATFILKLRSVLVTGSTTGN